MVVKAKKPGTVITSAFDAQPEIPRAADQTVTASTIEHTASPAAFITERQVMLGTAAALSPAPAFDIAEELATSPRSGWRTAVASLFSSSREPRPAHVRPPAKLDFTVGSRMAREMYRL